MFEVVFPSIYLIYQFYAEFNEIYNVLGQEHIKGFIELFDFRIINNLTNIFKNNGNKELYDAIIGFRMRTLMISITILQCIVCSIIDNHFNKKYFIFDKGFYINDRLINWKWIKKYDWEIYDRKKGLHGLRMYFSNKSDDLMKWEEEYIKVDFSNENLINNHLSMYTEV